MDFSNYIYPALICSYGYLCNVSQRHFPGSKFWSYFFTTDGVGKGLTAVTESLISSLCPIITDIINKVTVYGSSQDP